MFNGCIKLFEQLVICLLLETYLLFESFNFLLLSLYYMFAVSEIPFECLDFVVQLLFDFFLCTHFILQVLEIGLQGLNLSRIKLVALMRRNAIDQHTF